MAVETENINEHNFFSCSDLIQLCTKIYLKKKDDFRLGMPTDNSKNSTSARSTQSFEKKVLLEFKLIFLIFESATVKFVISELKSTFSFFKHHFPFLSLSLPLPLSFSENLLPLSAIGSKNLFPVQSHNFLLSVFGLKILKHTQATLGWTIPT